MNFLKCLLIFTINAVVYCNAFTQSNWSALVNTNIINTENTTLSFPNNGNLLINNGADSLLIGGDNNLHLLIIDNNKLSISNNGSSKTITLFNSQIEFSFENVKKSIKFKNVLKLDLNLETSSLYEDALALNNSSLGNDLKSKIYSKYKVESDNKFLPILPRNGADVSSTNTSTKSLISSAGGLDVTKLADGLAKFLVSRFKNELSISFFNRFSSIIQDDKYKDLRVLFGNTYNELNLIGTEIYDFQPYLSSLQQNMKLDLDRLATSFQKLLADNNSQLSVALDADKNTRYVLSTALDFSQEIKKDKHFGRVLGEFNFKPQPGRTVDLDLLGSLQSMQLFSEALKESPLLNVDKYWVDNDKIEALIKNAAFLKIFVGLVAQKAKNEGVKFKSESLFQIMHKQVDNLDNFVGIIHGFKTAIGSIEKALDNNKVKDSLVQQQSIIDYFEGGEALISNFSSINKLLKIEQPKIDSLLTIFNQASGLVKSIALKQYSQAILNAMSLANHFQKSKSNDAFKNTLTKFKKYGLFISQMAEAESADQVANVLETFAAPLGSWRDKRNSYFNVALDSYVGPAYYGKHGYSLSTPIGLSMSTALCKNLSLTLMTSLIDIGPLTAFRFKNDSTEVAKIYLKEIWSPGIFASLGIANKNPIFLNFGMQKGPLLERISANENEVNIKSKVLYSMSINVNIPLMNLVSNRK